LPSTSAPRFFSAATTRHGCCDLTAHPLVVGRTFGSPLRDHRRTKVCRVRPLFGADERDLVTDVLPVRQASPAYVECRLLLSLLLLLLTAASVTGAAALLLLAALLLTATATDLPEDRVHPPVSDRVEP
jgi:hypothetical protein